jgi:hypothetical protein
MDADRRIGGLGMRNSREVVRAGTTLNARA